MEVKQFINIEWHKDCKEYLKFYDFVNKTYELVEVKGNVKLERTDRKICIGYYDLLTMNEIPCLDQVELTESIYKRCKRCDAITGFNACLMCNGGTCNSNNKKAIDYCNSEHLIYLAYFDDKHIKVGTASCKRNIERLLEQGALFSFFIAKVPNGGIARQLESQISSFGYTKSINKLYKIKNLPVRRSKENIMQILLECYEDIYSNINDSLKKYFINPEFNAFDNIASRINSILDSEEVQISLFQDINEPSSFNRYDIETNTKGFEGEMLSAIGSIILISTENGIKAIDMNSLSGWVVNIDLL